MANGSITDEDVAELVRRTEDAAAAYMRGDMDRYLALTRLARGFTLMKPSGGAPASHDNRAESGAGIAGRAAEAAKPAAPARNSRRSTSS